MTAVSTVPRAVSRYARTVTTEIGTEPEITQTGPATWQVTLAGEHVTASATFRSRNGRTRYVSGALAVDGESRPPLPWAQLRKLWHEHENAGGAVLDPVPELPPDTELPPAVDQLFRQLWDAAAAGAIAGGQVLAGYDEASGRWVVGIDLPGGGARFSFVPLASSSQWSLGGARSIQVITDGVDISRGIGTDIARAIQALTGQHPEPGRKPEPVREEARGKRDQGVETRRHAVIRN